MRQVKLQQRLFLLVATAILPLMVMAGIGLWILAEQEQERVDRTALELARALLTGVDAELGRSIAVLEAMTMSPLLDNRRYAEFRNLAINISSARPHWVGITLSTPDGKPVVDTRSPPRRPGLEVVEKESFDTVARTAKPVVGYGRFGPRRRFAFPVRVPVVRDGQVRYVLSAIVTPESVLAVVQRQRLPRDWVAAVFDAKNVRVARSRMHEESVGTPPSPSLLALMQRGGVEGTGITQTIDGHRVFTAYSKSPETGWSVAIGIAPEFALVGRWYSLAAFGFGIALSIALSVLAALLIARHINRPIGQLAEAARSLGSGATPAAPITDIQEIRDVGDALIAASQERKRHETEREGLLAREQDARTSAEAANRAKDEFLAMLGHELRNPLGAISNAVQLLQHPRIDEQRAANARGIITRQVDHLARMTDDLLDAARAITGKISLHKQPIELAEAVASALVTLKPRAENHRLVQSLAPVWVDADATRIDQIVSNLVGNAIKYTPAGGTIRVDVARENEQAVLRVIDSGVGMPPELTARVFDLFVQGTRELDRSHGGLGIGLTLVRRLTELHGGSVEARSDGPGKGSEFVVRLPARAAPSSSIPDAQKESEAPPVARDVVVIEDNPDLREALRQVLEFDGHRVRAAGDGEAGLAAILSSPPDIALIDVGLPKLDGYEIVRRVRSALAPDARPLLVALTGYGLPEDRRRALDAGFDAHLVKPIQKAALEELLVRTGKRGPH